MALRTSRREEICRAAITLASRGGSHAVTHQGIDAELGISRGSTSYYYRTRAVLITAVADHLAASSRAVFVELLAQHSGGDPTAIIETYLRQMTTTRRDHVRARLALLLDAHCAPDQQKALSECLFSRDAAVELFRSQAHPIPVAAATDLLDGLEGRILREVLLR